jgi:hypothetical protein
MPIAKWVAPGVAQEGPTGTDPLELFDARQRAFELVERGEHAAALPLLRRLTAATPHDGEAWLRLASCHYRAGAWDEAIAAYERALELGFGYASSVHYDVACCHARAGRVDEAFAALDRALATRWEDRSTFSSDGDLAALRDDERWSAVAGQLQLEVADPIEGWRLDLEFLMDEIDRLHVDEGQAAPRAELEAAAAALFDRIPELPEHRIPVQMQRIVRLLGDGHSVVYPVTRRAPPTQLPLDFWWFEEGLHVVDARPGFEEWIGARVLAIGEGEAERFADDLAPLVTRDNPMGILWLGPFYLRFPAVLHDLGYVDGLDAIPLVLERPDGRLAELVVEPVAPELGSPKLVPCALAPETPLYLRDVGNEYWHELLDGGVLYVQFNAVLDKADEPLADFARRLRDVVAAEEPDHLVLDLRHNNGGTSYLSTEVVRTLVHFETTRPGRLYVLIGRNTFSAAQIFLTDVERFTDAILVGEPSGSRPNMVSEETQVVLPYSGTVASISCRYFQQSWPGDDRTWIVPDVPVPLRAEDWLAGRDPVMDVVLEHAGR